MKKFLIPFFIGILSVSCAQETKQVLQKSKSENTTEAYFASGCFWCVEAIFESVKGVSEAISGYAGGTQKNPTYKNVSYGLTDHAEAVKVIYNPEIVSFSTLVQVFYGSHDPTTLNQQGPDRGRQYRSIAFYQNTQEKQIIERITNQLNKEKFNEKITTEIQLLKRFYKAEDYHQNYEKLHPDNPYVQSVSVPRLNRFKNKFPHLLKSEAKLTH